MRFCSLVRRGNIYSLSFDDLSLTRCLVVKDDEATLWHKRLGHASMSLLNKLKRKELVRGLPHQNFESNRICKACTKGKFIRSSFHAKNVVSTSRVLELVHMDLFGPNDIASLGGKKYYFVSVDDFSRFTLVYFLEKKSETCDYFSKFVKWFRTKKKFQ